MKNFVSSILSKLNLARRTQAAAFVAKHHVGEPPAGTSDSRTRTAPSGEGGGDVRQADQAATDAGVVRDVAVPSGPPIT